MNNPAEHSFIEKIKHLVECRLEWVDSKEWKNRDYEYLSELIFGKTKIAISVSTLKRIWHNDRLRTPHNSTLNALARFLDYENWNDFKTKLKNEIKPAVKIEERTMETKLHIPWGWIVFTLLAVVLILYLTNKGLPRLNKDSSGIMNPENIVFTSKKTITSGLPNTVVFNYDISGITFDSAFIQQDWDKRRRKPISKENHYHTSIYYYPGFYSARLVINDQEVKKFPLFITTDGWLAVYKKDFNQEIPVYLKNIDLIKENGLHVSVEDLAMNKIVNDQDFLIGFYNARDFGEVYCDSFSFETEVKNDPKDGGLTCQYTVITVEGKEGIMTASVSEKGCTSNLFLQFADNYVDGSTHDLSDFGTDLSVWRNVRYKVVNKNAEIYIDNKKIYQIQFNRDIGKIICISYYFYGCGAVRMAKLSDSKGKVVYEEFFDQ